MPIPLVGNQKLKQILDFLGSETRLENLVHDFYLLMSQDILIGFFFVGKDLKSIAHRQTLFLLAAMGVKLPYEGKIPQKAHEGMPLILSGHFDRRIFLLRGFLKNQGLPDVLVELWVNFELSFREVIIKSN